MRARVTSLAVVCLLLISLPAVAQQDIISAVPGDAFGFAATNNLQGSYDKLMALGAAMGIPVPPENQLLALQELVGDIDLNGPAAIILLDPEAFDEPVALLLSATDTQAVFQSRQADAEDAEAGLPSGVLKLGYDAFLGVKGDFVVFAPGAEQASAVMASESSLETMPAVRAAFDKGQIVLAGDLKQATPMILTKLQMIQAMMAGQMDSAPMPNADMIRDMFSLYMDLAQDFMVQTDKLAVAVDVRADRAVVSKYVLFDPASEAAGLINSQMGQAVPSYNALPGGPFLMAGGVGVAPGLYEVMTADIMNKMMNLPSFKGKIPAAETQQMIADSTAASSLLSNVAMTLNIGNPMTGLLNIVVQGDVSDASAYKTLTKKVYESKAQALYSRASGMPVEYMYTGAAETCSGVEVDTIKMQMTEDAAADPMIAQQMQMVAMMYGPDMTFRMAAPTDGQILYTMGGGAELMERAINVAQGHGSSLASEASIRKATSDLPAERFAEFHLDLSQVMPMMMMLAMGQPGAGPSGAPAPPISFSCSAETNTLRADMVLHAATVRGLVEAVGPMIMQQRGGPVLPPDEEF